MIRCNYVFVNKLNVSARDEIQSEHVSSTGGSDNLERGGRSLQEKTIRATWPGSCIVSRHIIIWRQPGLRPKCQHTGQEKAT